MSVTWTHVTNKIDERVKELTDTCLSLSASVDDIRAAQAGIDELKRLLTLPETLKNTAVQKSRSTGTRGGY